MDLRLACAVLLLPLASLAQARPQQCIVPGPGDVSIVWGGETRGLYAWSQGGNDHVLTGEDGGRIKLSRDGGATWDECGVPADYTHAVLDITMADNGIDGWACGRGGWVLTTSDGGCNWSYLGPQILDPCEDPATLWAIHPLGNGIFMLGGLWLFKYSVDGGQSWIDFEVYEDAAMTVPLPATDLHVYDVTAVGGLGNFRGSVAAEWHRHGTTPAGIVLYTDADIAPYSLGRKWHISLNDAEVPPTGTLGGSMIEPWAIQWQPGYLDEDVAVGYVVGGPGGNSPSRFYKTVNGGRSWDYEGETRVTMYTVAVSEAGNAIVSGYSGFSYTLVGGSWIEDIQDTLNPDQPNGLGQGMEFQGAILRSATTDDDTFYIGGSFGIQRKTTDYGTSWSTISPYYANLMEKEWRLLDCWFDPLDPDTGVVVGQFFNVAKTTDGGSSWTQEHVDVGSGSYLRSVVFRDSMNGIAVGDQGKVLYTDNGGDDWSAGSIDHPNPSKMTLTDVVCFGTDEAWAVGYRQNKYPENRLAFVLYSDDDGVTWRTENRPIGTECQLTAVAAPNPDELLVVGFAESPSNGPVALSFSGEFDGDAIDWTPVSPDAPAIPDPYDGRKLLGLALVGNDLATATAYTVGNAGMVLQWDGSGWIDVPDVYERHPVTHEWTKRMLACDLEAVGISPSGNRVLIGGQVDVDIEKADDFGLLLRRDELGEWDCIPARTGKDIRDIYLYEDGEGYLVGLARGVLFTERLGCDGFDGEPSSSSFDHGNLADSSFMRYSEP